jgi:hypothetical protein
MLKMVLERKPEWDLNETCNKDVNQALRFVHETFAFKDEEQVQKNLARFITVLAKIENSNLPPQPISQDDFFRNTLHPILEKGKKLLRGRKPFLKRCEIQGNSLVFVFSGGQNR